MRMEFRRTSCSFVFFDRVNWNFVFFLIKKYCFNKGWPHRVRRSQKVKRSVPAKCTGKDAGIGSLVRSKHSEVHDIYKVYYCILQWHIYLQKLACKLSPGLKCAWLLPLRKFYPNIKTETRKRYENLILLFMGFKLLKTMYLRLTAGWCSR